MCEHNGETNTKKNKPNYENDKISNDRSADDSNQQLGYGAGYC